MEKELIGYRLKDQKHERAAVEICKAYSGGFCEIDNFTPGIPDGTCIGINSAVEE